MHQGGGLRFANPPYALVTHYHDPRGTESSFCCSSLMQTNQLLAGVVILSLFGLAVGRLINLLETRLLIGAERHCESAMKVLTSREAFAHVL